MTNDNAPLDADNWRQRAAEARSAAERLTDTQARKDLLGIADSYEKLARRAEQRAQGGS
jgi:hypothetical protein